MTTNAERARADLADILREAKDAGYMVDTSVPFDVLEAAIAALSQAQQWEVVGEGKLPGYVQTALATCEPHHADTLRDYIATLSAPVADAVRGTADYVPGRLDLEAPPRIWLQIDTAGDNDDRDDHWPGSENVTWQDESIGGLEIEYVRADLATQNPVGDAVRGLVPWWRTRIGPVEHLLKRAPDIRVASGAILECADELESALAAQPCAGDGWLPIETAPRGGRELILLLTPSGFPQVAYSNTWWTSGFSVECKPTRWARIPQLTAAQAQGGGQ